MRVYEILQIKGDAVYQISPSASLSDAVDQMVRYNCGSLLVSDGQSVDGIITERDILKSIASERRDLRELRVCDFMSKDLITGHPDDDVDSVMGLMTGHRLRHLPIIVNDRVAGMISIGDVVKARCDSLACENHNMRAYIQS